MYFALFTTDHIPLIAKIYIYCWIQKVVLFPNTWLLITQFTFSLKGIAFHYGTVFIEIEQGKKFNF